jgi:hypothetical protein
MKHSLYISGVEPVESIAKCKTKSSYNDELQHLGDSTDHITGSDARRNTGQKTILQVFLL